MGNNCAAVTIGATIPVIPIVTPPIVTPPIVTPPIVIPPDADPVPDVYGCYPTLSHDNQTMWCESAGKCISYNENCAYSPIGTVEPPVATTCQGFNRNGAFDISCLIEGGNSLFLIIGIALLGGILMTR